MISKELTLGAVNSSSRETYSCDEIKTQQTAETILETKTTKPLTSNGALLVLVELAFDKAQHQAGLSHR